MKMIGLRGVADEGGQSLVEVALCLPILLLIVIGIVDIGRIYSYKVAVTNAAREAAFYAATDAQSTSSSICERAITEFTQGSVADCALVAPSDPDFDSLSETWRSPTLATVTVTCTRAPAVACGSESAFPVLFQTSGAAGAEVTVTVRYQVSLVSAFLISRMFDPTPVRVGATATFVGLGE